MKNKKNYMILLVAIILVFSLAACSSQSSQQPSSGENNAPGDANEAIELRIVTATPEDDVLSLGYPLFKEYIENNTDKIKITYVGGPEALPPFELGEAIRNQVVDIIVTPGAYYSDVVPENMLLSYSEKTTQEEIENGAIDYLDEIHQEKLNAKLLGRASEDKFIFYTNKEIQTIDDFKGMTIRGVSLYGPFIQALGAEMVTMPGGEIYTALERGVVDAYGWGTSGITTMGLEEITKYVIHPDFYRMNVVMAMNLDKWNELGEERQQIVMDAMADMQSRLPAAEAEFIERESAIFEEKGIRTVDLGDEYRELAYESAWNWMRNQFPDQIDEMEELFR